MRILVDLNKLFKPLNHVHLVFKFHNLTLSNLFPAPTLASDLSHGIRREDYRQKKNYVKSIVILETNWFQEINALDNELIQF